LVIGHTEKVEIACEEQMVLRLAGRADGNLQKPSQFRGAVASTAFGDILPESKKLSA
jgi:hypothetical protein